MIERIQFFVDIKAITLSDDQLYLKINKDNKIAKDTIELGMNLVIPLIDTYLLVLLTIDQICGKNIVLNKRTLTRELHVAFKTLYTENELIPYLSSCIKEIVRTSI